MTRYSLRGDIDRWYAYGIYLPNRTLWMGSVSADSEEGESGVDFAMAERVVKGLHLLEATVGPISILMNNIGGCINSGIAIYDAIRACKNHVSITVYGVAMSMGAVILQAADDRILAPNASMMIHHCSWGGEEPLKYMEQHAKEMRRLNDWVQDLLLTRIRQKHEKFRRDKLDRLCNFDHYLTAQEGVDLGLADRLLALPGEK